MEHLYEAITAKLEETSARFSDASITDNFEIHASASDLGFCLPYPLDTSSQYAHSVGTRAKDRGKMGQWNWLSSRDE